MRYHIITFGCQMNKSDSERVAAVFEHINCSAANSPKEADFIVVNACSVRQAAIDRIWGLVENFKKIKPDRDFTTILTGCLLEKDRKKFKGVFDLVFDIKNLMELEKFLHQKVVYTDEDYFHVLPKTATNYQAFVPIMTGCNNYCSYCAVPYVRGREKSRAVREILLEIKKLVQRGCTAVELLGQNVNSFSPADRKNFSPANPFKHDFARLLWEVNQIDGIKRIHFSASHPKDMSNEVIRALALPRQVNYVHVALQSGDDKILRKMNRKYKIADFAKIIQKIRKIKPGIAIGTDIIVGFPGETREQFMNTLRFYKKIKFDISFNAMYSARSGTAAAELADNVSNKEKRRRWHELQAVMEKITLVKNKKYVGRDVEVLVDFSGANYCEGNSREMKRVRIMNGKRRLRAGDIIKAKIREAKEWILLAEVSE